MSVQDFDILTGTSILGENIGWNPQSVIVDNMANQWLYLPDASRFVPPYTSGAVFPLQHANSCNALWKAPVGITQPLRTAGGAHLTFTDVVLAYVPGTPNPPGQIIQASYITIAIGVGTGTFSGNQGSGLGNVAYNIVGWDFGWVPNIAVFPAGLNIQAALQSAPGGPFISVSLSQGNIGESIVFPTPFVTPVGASLTCSGSYMGGVSGTVVSLMRYYLS